MLKILLPLITISFFVACNSPSPKEQNNVSNDEKFKTTISKEFEEILDKSSKVTIAVMPISDKESSKDFVDYFRKDILNKLEYKGYSVIDPKKLDEALFKLGKESPEKIKSITKEELRELTSADFLLYGRLKTEIEAGKIYYKGSLVLRDLEQKVMWSCYSSLDIEQKEGIDPLSLVVDTLLSGGTAAIGIVFDITKADLEIKKGLNFFVDSLLSSLLDGPIDVSLDNGLLNSATEIK